MEGSADSPPTRRRHDRVGGRRSAGSSVRTTDRADVVGRRDRNLRVHFRRIVGVSPSDYRRTFG
ncbi:hypothetical protein ASG23_13185 [Cellulomonas sp. Leaf395]|nr:hypothetical protein ASG23_13185 [Cellulomonas sp. Leaf395]